MTDAFGDLVAGAADAVALLVVVWIVVVGAIGAAIGQRHGRPAVGAAVSLLVPLPVLNWLIAYGVVSRAGGRSQAADQEIFTDLLG